ncbi:MAG: hypothetical protein R2699_03135 [Acidimicrobiales bacterium]
MRRCRSGSTRPARRRPRGRASAQHWADGSSGGALIVALTGVLVVVALVRSGWRHPLTGVVVTQLALLTIAAADVIGPERNASRTTLPLAVAAVVMVATLRPASPWRACSTGHVELLPAGACGAPPGPMGPTEPGTA